MHPPMNPDFPLAEVRSVAHLMDIASAMEREAASRFEQLAAQLAAHGHRETARLFRELADEEREHETEIARWAAREDGRVPTPAVYRWRMPETFDPQDLDAEGLDLTVHEALELAVHNEERAFAFYSYLAAMATEEPTRLRAEALARGELEHVARLRAKRRAWAGPDVEREETSVPGSITELQRLADGLAAGTARLDAVLTAALQGNDEPSNRALRERLADQAGQGANGAVGAAPSRVVRTAEDAGLLQPGLLTAAGALQLARKDAEQNARTYLDIAARAADQSVMDEAQRLGEAAVARLVLISRHLDART